jgi:hypothetical protein
MHGSDYEEHGLRDMTIAALWHCASAHDAFNPLGTELTDAPSTMLCVVQVLMQMHDL